MVLAMDFGVDGHSWQKLSQRQGPTTADDGAKWCRTGACTWRCWAPALLGFDGAIAWIPAILFVDPLFRDPGRTHWHFFQGNQFLLLKVWLIGQQAIPPQAFENPVLSRLLLRDQGLSMQVCFQTVLDAGLPGIFGISGWIPSSYLTTGTRPKTPPVHLLFLLP